MTQRKWIKHIYTDAERLYFGKGDDVYPANSITGEIYDRDGYLTFECYGCGFEFGAEFRDDTEGSTADDPQYTCPLCGHPDKKQPELIYLAAPYTSSLTYEQVARYEKITALAGRMTQAGQIVYSPITYSHNLVYGMHVESNFDWYRHGLLMLAKCDKLIVYNLPGWTQSKGVALEIEEAQRLGMPIEYEGDADADV